MVIQCPNCQKSLTFETQKLEDDPKIVCEGCSAFLNLKIVPELLTMTESPVQVEDKEPISNLIKEPDQRSDNIQDPDPEVDDLKDEEETIMPPEPIITFRTENPDFDSDELDYPFESPHESAGDKKKIAVCIDGEATREVVQEVLKDSYYHLLDIPSEMSRLVSAKIDSPDLALIDAGLGGDAVCDLVNAIRKNPAFCETIFILVGSMYEKNTRYRNEQPSLLGADDYIGRYYIQRDLLELIRKNIDSSQGRSNKDNDKTGETIDDHPAPEEESKPPLLEPFDSNAGESREDHSIDREEEEVEVLGTASPEIDDVEEKPAEYFSAETKEYEPGTVENPTAELETAVGPNHSSVETEEAGTREQPTNESKEDAIGDNSKEHDEAKRLARIIVSDIFIYNEDKIKESLRNETFLELLEEEIEDGRKLYASKVSEALHAISNYYEETLENTFNKIKDAFDKEINESEIASGLIQTDEDAALSWNAEEEKDTAQVVSQDTDEADLFSQAVSSEVHDEENLSESVATPIAKVENYSQPVSLNTSEEDSEEVKNAKRLSRIIVSDIVIYNEDKVEEGLKTNRFYEILGEEIEEGRQLYESRVDQRFLNKIDYLQEAFDDFINKKKASVS